jgi:adenine-specific DNA-methyltransferase
MEERKFLITSITKHERLITIEEIANFFTVNIGTVQQWINKGELQAIKVNRTYRITMEEFQDFLNRNMTSKTS